MKRWFRRTSTGVVLALGLGLISAVPAAAARPYDVLAIDAGELKFHSRDALDLVIPAPLWLTTPLVVISGPGSLVIVSGSQSSARGLLRQVENAQVAVRRVLPRWDQRAMVQMPASVDAFTAALGSPLGHHDEVAAAVAAGHGAGFATSAGRVVLNPELIPAMGPQALQVLLTHEFTHLATNAAQSQMPLWLLEGFAEYVALRDRAVPDRVTLGRAIAQAREHGVPTQLPGEAQFGLRGDELLAAYEMAWLASRVLADRVGERGLRTVYRAVEGGKSMSRALSEAGLPKGELLREWRARLQDLAG